MASRALRLLRRALPKSAEPTTVAELDEALARLDKQAEAARYARGDIRENVKQLHEDADPEDAEAQAHLASLRDHEKAQDDKLAWIAARRERLELMRAPLLTAAHHASWSKHRTVLVAAAQSYLDALRVALTRFDAYIAAAETARSAGHERDLVAVPVPARLVSADMVAHYAAELNRFNAPPALVPQPTRPARQKLLPRLEDVPSISHTPVRVLLGNELPPAVPVPRLAESARALPAPVTGGRAVRILRGGLEIGDFRAMPGDKLILDPAHAMALVRNTAAEFVDPRADDRADSNRENADA